MGIYQKESLKDNIKLKRQDMIAQLADMICKVKRHHPLRVGIDGVDGAGKSYLANALIKPLKNRSWEVIRASIDDFHNPEFIRYQRGENSPEGYYRDSFNLEAVISLLLKPLGQPHEYRYCLGIFDYLNDKRVQLPWQVASPRSILLFDGVFLHRPELSPFWDLSIFLHVDFEVSISRAISRDLLMSKKGENKEKIRWRYENRYIPGQRLYLNEAHPLESACLVLDNNDYNRPFWIKNSCTCC